MKRLRSGCRRHDCSDEIVGAMAGYVFEHFEIASTALIAAAKTAGDAETVVCEEILVQEEPWPTGWR